MRKLSLLVVAASVSACAASTPPAPPQPREATKVNASLGKTWDAVIDAFAAANIPIKTMERASGFISTDALSVDRESGKRYADCGTAIGITIPASQATYNVLVRGDSMSATVRATVRFTDPSSGSYDRGIECTSRGVWEHDFETKVKGAAEGKASSGAP